MLRFYNNLTVAIGLADVPNPHAHSYRRVSTQISYMFLSFTGTDASVARLVNVTCIMNSAVMTANYT